MEPLHTELFVFQGKIWRHLTW